MHFALHLVFAFCASACPLHAAAPAPAISPAKDKAATISIPRIDFREAKLGDALDYLALKSRQLDRARTGVNLVLRVNGEAEERAVTLALENKSLLEILQTLARLTDCVVRVEPGALVFQPKDYQVETRKWTDDDEEARKMEMRLAAISVGAPSTTKSLSRTFARLSDSASGAIAPVPLRLRLSAKAADNREVQMTVNDISLRDALRYLCESADLRMRVSRHGVDLFPNRPSMSARNREWLKNLEATGDATPPVLATPADVEIFLRRNGETAENFAAAFSITQDAQWLERGRKRFPDDPALLTFACATEERAAEGRALAAHAQKADLDSVLPWLFEAKAALAAGNAQDALRALGEALTKPKLGMDMEWLLPQETRLLIEAGEEPAEAECTAAMGTGTSATLAVVALLRFKKMEMAEDERSELGRNLVVLSSRYRKAGHPQLLISELVLNAIERTGLEMLPQGEIVPELRMVPSARIEQIEKRAEAIGKLTSRSLKLAESLPDKDPAALREFNRRVRADGEEKALVWSLEQYEGKK